MSLEDAFRALFFHSPRNLSLPFLVCYQAEVCRERILSGGFPSPICPYHHCKRSWGFIIPAAPCRSRCRSIHRVSHILWAPCAAIGHRHGLYRQLSEARSGASAPLVVFSAKDAAFWRFCQHFPHTFLCRFAAGLPSVSAPCGTSRPAASSSRACSRADSD